MELLQSCDYLEWCLSFDETYEFAAFLGWFEIDVDFKKYNAGDFALLFIDKMCVFDLVLHLEIEIAFLQSLNHKTIMSRL